MILFLEQIHLGLSVHISELLLDAMQTDAFERSLRAFVRRTPFQPFTVELISGTRFQVLHPEALAFNGGLAVYIGTDGTPSLFDHESVSQLVGSADSQSTPAA